MVEACRPAWGNPPVEVLINEAAVVTAPVPRFDGSNQQVGEKAGPRPSANQGEPGHLGPGERLQFTDHSSHAVDDRLENRPDDDAARCPCGEASGVADLGFHVDRRHQPSAGGTGLPVLRGDPEATALGNPVVQGIGLGHFGGRDEADRWLATAS
jgi:hypothetical protein